MPRTCTICGDTRRRRIERDRSNGSQSFAALARTYGVGLASLKRHFKNCTAPLPKNSARPPEPDGPADAVRFASEHDLSTPSGMVSYLQELALRAKPNEVAPLLTLASKLSGAFEQPAIQPKDVDLKALFNLSDADVLAIVAEGRARLNEPLPISSHPARELPKPWKKPITNS